MEQEMEDLRLMALALARLDSFNEKKALSHDFIMEKFGA
jgi:antitoxin StbD